MAASGLQAAGNTGPRTSSMHARMAGIVIELLNRSENDFSRNGENWIPPKAVVDRGSLSYFSMLLTFLED